MHRMRVWQDRGGGGTAELRSLSVRKVPVRRRVPRVRCVRRWEVDGGCARRDGVRGHSNGVSNSVAYAGADARTDREPDSRAHDCVHSWQIPHCHPSGLRRVHGMRCGRVHS